MPDHIADGRGEGHVAGVNPSNRLLTDAELSVNDIPVDTDNPLPIEPFAGNSSNFALDVARGKIPGISVNTIVAVNPGIGNASFEDIWDTSTENLVYPTVAESWEIVSDSASDTSAGTGARTVAIVSLDDSFVIQEQIVTMNGTTPVVLTGTHFRPRISVVITAGSNQVNIGDLTLQVASGGAIRSLIRADLGVTFNSHYTVPAGKRAFLTFITIDVPKNNDAKIRLLVRDNTVTDGAFTKRLPITTYQAISTVAPARPIIFTEKVDVKLTAKSNNLAVEVIAVMQFDEVDI